MAITFITGIPRSGKTYYAMFLLYMSFIFQEPITWFTKIRDRFFPKKTLTKKYDVAYTNINQFDFSVSDKIKPYDYNQVQVKLIELHKLYLEKATDEILIANAKVYGLYNALFIIDEAQNFFSSDNAVSTWWITYHGHLHQDLIFITQNLELINSKYTKQGEFFYKAVPPSSRIFPNKFRYVQFNSSKIFQKDKIGDFHVPMVPEIFNMYVSGAQNNSKSVVKKYLAIFSALFVLLVIVFLMFISQFDTSKNVDKNTTASPDKNASVVASTPPPAYDLPQYKQKNDKTQKIERDISKDELFEIHCIDMLCNYKGSDFPLPLFNKLTSKLSPDFIWFFKNASYTQYYVMLPADTFDFLQIGEKENDKHKEKDSKSPSQKLPMAIASHK